jgi:enoyl-CoA hydratase/carnithine racemase
MRTPLIAQVHGYALAGGCGLAVGCDVVVASEDAVFGLPEILSACFRSSSWRPSCARRVGSEACSWC